MDLVAPEPLLEWSAGVQDLDLDVTQDDVAPPPSSSSEDGEQETGRTQQEVSAEGERP